MFNERPSLTKKFGTVAGVLRRNRRVRRVKLSSERYEKLRSVFGMWADRTDIGDDWLKDNRSNWTSTWKDD